MQEIVLMFIFIRNIKFINSYVLAYLFLAACATEAISCEKEGYLSNSKEEILLEVVSFNNGRLTAIVGFNFNKPVSIFSWRGNIYPRLGRELFIEAVSSNGSDLLVESKKKALPKIPIKKSAKSSDEFYVTTDNYVYPEALGLLITEKKLPVSGCIKIKAIYDATKSKIEYLSKIRVESIDYEVCSKGLDMGKM